MMTIMFSIIVLLIAFKAEGRGRVSVIFPFSPIFSLFWWLTTTLNDAVTNPAPKPVYLGLHFRLMFRICMHCLHFSGI